jgi:arabinose-5-phosphate isomerase
VDVRAATVGEVMTRAPRSIGPDALAVEAVELMERLLINQLLVVNETGVLVGALNTHDLLQAKVI